MSPDEELEGALRALEDDPAAPDGWLRLEQLAYRFGRPFPAGPVRTRPDAALAALAAGPPEPVAIPPGPGGPPAASLAGAVEAWASQALEAYLDPFGGPQDAPVWRELRRRLAALPPANLTRVLVGPYRREPLVLGWDEVLPTERVHARVRDGRLTDLIGRVVRDADVAEAVLVEGFLHSWDVVDLLVAVGQRMPQRRFVAALERVAPRDPRRARRLGETAFQTRLGAMNFPPELRVALRALGRAGE